MICYVASIIQDLWYFLSGPEEKNWIISYELVKNDYDIVHDLLKIEDVMIDRLKDINLVLLQRDINPLTRQANNIVYFDTFALIVKLNSILVVLSIPIDKHCLIYELNVKNAFCNREIQELCNWRFA